MKPIFYLLIIGLSLPLHAKQVEFYLAPVKLTASDKSEHGAVKFAKQNYYPEKSPRISGSDVVSCDLTESEMLKLPPHIRLETHILRFKLTHEAAQRYNLLLESGDKCLILMVNRVPVMCFEFPKPENRPSLFYDIMKIDENTGIMKLGITPKQDVIEIFRKTEPNQSPEPMPMAVTPPAAQASR